jgi:hypothetical protein
MHIQEHGDDELALVQMREALARKFAVHGHSEGENPTAIDGLVLFRLPARARATLRPAC